MVVEGGTIKKYQNYSINVTWEFKVEVLAKWDLDENNKQQNK